MRIVIIISLLSIFTIAHAQMNSQTPQNTGDEKIYQPGERAPTDNEANMRNGIEASRILRTDVSMQSQPNTQPIGRVPGVRLEALSDRQANFAPILNEGSPNTIPGQYIVVFKRGPEPAHDDTLTRGRIRGAVERQTAIPEDVRAAQAMVEELGGEVLFTYTSALIGFSFKIPEDRAEQALKILREMPGVDYIEADQRVSTTTIWTQPPTPSSIIPPGLDRISERFLPLDGFYTYDGRGNGVNAYVIDTGIRITHDDFDDGSGTSRAFGGYTAIADGNGTDDCHSHGTNVAGILGGLTYGVAKDVTLHSVRVMDCAGSGTVAGAIAGVDWVTNNAILPAVANMSLEVTGGSSTTLDTAVVNSIASGVTYVLAAGNSDLDACNRSPARVPEGITVGAIQATNDTRWGQSNWGTCLDIFATGVNVVAAGIANDSATTTYTGTSQASPHVAGVAARYLSDHPAKTPAQVWDRINLIANKPTTAGWAGIVDRGTGSPDQLLIWKALSDSADDGDPHIRTVDGVRYDFQSAGEFVALREGNGLEIQTRQTPISTSHTITNGHTGLASCVSLNTAVAAHVGGHRVSYQPNLSGVPDPSGMQLRIDGVLTTLDAQGINLGSGGRVSKAPAGTGAAFEFPDGTSLIATAIWSSSRNMWYINIGVHGTPATEGLMGAVKDGWLPALPDGTSLGSKPGQNDMHQRYVDLNQTFANAWRVTHASSLFDYAPGTSTATFTNTNWPPENGACVVPASPPTKPLPPRTAKRVCRKITDKGRNDNCEFDVEVMGDRGFAKAYLLGQKIEAGATRTTLNDNSDPNRLRDAVTYIATVRRMASIGEGVPAGTIQFLFDDSKAGKPIKLDSRGQVSWQTSRDFVGDHWVSARYTPARRSVYLASSSQAAAPLAPLKTGKKGMTFMTVAGKHPNPTTGTAWVGCKSKGKTDCDPYKGDTVCSTPLPLLCINPGNASKPASIVVPSQYHKWSGGVIGTTKPYPAAQFSTIGEADHVCAKEFGDGWRVAEFHDGWGWNFQAFGNVGDPHMRFWVDINDQPNGTCWSR